MRPENEPDTVIDTITASVVQSVPWMTDPITESIRDLTDHRKISRVKEMVDKVISHLIDFQSELSELYVKTPGFKRLLAVLVRTVADEPLDYKRDIYTAFMTLAIVSPLDSLESHLCLVNVIKETGTDHRRLLRVLKNLPAPQTPYPQSPLQMLQALFPDIPRDRLEGLLRQITELGLSDITDWSSTLPEGPERVRRSFTVIGWRFIRILESIQQRE